MKKALIKSTYVKRRKDSYGHIKTVIEPGTPHEYVVQTISDLQAYLVEQKDAVRRSMPKKELSLWQKWKRANRRAREDFNNMLEDMCRSIVGTPAACPEERK